MTSDERARIGQKLRALRLREGLTQAELVAAMPQEHRISVATLKAIENARTKFLVRDSNIECYAAFFGTSVTALLREDDPRPLLATNPLLEDLHDEHLALARRYVFARKQIRAAIDVLLDPHAPVPLASVTVALAKWTPDHLAQLSTALSDPHLAQIVTSLVADAGFRDVVTRALHQTTELPATLPAALRKPNNVKG